MTRPPAVSWEKPQAACLQLLLMHVRPPRWSRGPWWFSGRSVGQTAVVCGNTLFDLATAASPAVSPTVCLSQALCRAPQAAPTRDCVAMAGVWWVPDCVGMLKFRLSIINRLIHSRLSIMEKFETIGDTIGRERF